MFHTFRRSLRASATGFGIAAIFLGGVLVTNLGGFLTRLQTAEHGLWLGFGVFMALGLIFSVVQAFLTASEPEDHPRPPRGRRMKEQPVPVRVRVASRNKRR